MGKRTASGHVSRDVWRVTRRSKLTARIFKMTMSGCPLAGFSVVVDAGGGDVGVAEPLLDLATSAWLSSASVTAAARSAWAPILKPSCAE
jgi:hypothetical protein